MLRALRFSLVAALQLCLASPALADGKGFGRTVQSIETPAQRVAIVFDGTRETLVVDTSFQTNDPDAAWIVPLPAKPTIEPVEDGFFEALDAVFSPRLSTQWSWFATPVAVIVAIVSVLMRRGWRMTADGIAVCLILCIMVLLTLPTLSRARGGTSAICAGVNILNSARVGAFETTVLSGTSGQVIVDWLSAAGYYVPSEAIPVLDDYCKDGWVFAAAKLASDAGQPLGASGVIRPHPLAFVFTTHSAVYPLRLTGVQRAPCTAKVFVFGPSQASIPGLSPVLACRATTDEDPEPTHSITTRWTNNAALLKRLGQQRTATVLKGELTPDQMRHDAQLSWSPLGHGLEWSASSRTYAWTRAADLGVATILCTLLCGFRLGRSRGRFATGLVRGAVPLGIATGIGVYFAAIPVATTEVPLGLRDGIQLRGLLFVLNGKLESHSLDCDSWRREFMAAAIIGLHSPETQIDFDTPPTPGVGPGQFQIRCEGVRHWAVYVDARGREQELRLE